MRYNVVNSIEDVRQELIKHYTRRYGGNNQTRKLVVNKSYSDHGTVGAVFFALDGSPPKGYAIYVPEHRLLFIIEPANHRKFENIHVNSEQFNKEIKELKE